MACRWHELFDEFTPDTFHPKLFSLSGLVSEAAAIADFHKDHEAWLKHLIRVQAELAERLEGGVEFQVCSMRHRGMLERMSKSQLPSEVAAIGRVLNLEGLQSTLENEISNRVRELDLEEVIKKKEKTDNLLTCLATHAFRKGCSSEDTHNIAEILPQGSETARQWILECLPDNEKQFDCIIAVKVADKDIFAAVKSVCGNAHIKHTSPKIPGLPNLKDVIFLRRKESALRPIDAVEHLKEDVRSSLNILALYQQRTAPAILPDAWIISGDGAEEISVRIPSFRNLHPRRDAVRLADKAVESLGSSGNEPAIRAALDLHNIALSMADHRLRLVNLWSALECLASLVEGNSIISRIEQLVCPILTWRKIDKIVRYHAISIHLWLRSNPSIDRGTLPFGLGHNESVSVERILTLLTEPEKSKGIMSLLAVVGKHPLLVHRTFVTWKHLTDPKRLSRDLTLSSKRLGWHLWRIYRARNLLVHQGIEPEFLPQLANHLQQYLSWTLSRLLHGMSFGAAWTTRDSLVFWRSKAEHLQSTLSSDPDSLLLRDVFPEELVQPDLRIYNTRNQVAPA